MKLKYLPINWKIKIIINILINQLQLKIDESALISPAFTKLHDNLRYSSQDWVIPLKPKNWQKKRKMITLTSWE